MIIITTLVVQSYKNEKSMAVEQVIALVLVTVIGAGFIPYNFKKKQQEKAGKLRAIKVRVGENRK